MPHGFESVPPSQPRAQVIVKFEQLNALLGLPAGHTIRAVVPIDQTDLAHDRVRFLIEGPDLRRAHPSAPPEVVGWVRDLSGASFFEK